MTASSAGAESPQQSPSRSTGPKTLVGKAAVARNALKHGATATKALLPGEEAEFNELVARLTDEFGPVGPVEERLVVRLAHSFLRCQRADLFLKGALEGEDVSEVGIGRAFYRDAFKADALTKALRHVSASERSALLLTHELQRLRAARTTGENVLVPALDVVVSAPEAAEFPDEG